MPIPFTRPHDEIMVDKRLSDCVCEAAREGKIDYAIEKAKQITEDWYRCQAFSSIAGHVADNTTRLSLIHEALHAAYRTEEPNRIVTVGSWAIEVIARAGERRLLQTEVDRLIQVANSEPHPTRRIDALFWLFQLLRRGNAPEHILRQVLKEFWQTAESGHGWKRDRNLRQVAVMLARRGWRDEAERTANLIEKAHGRRRAFREMSDPPSRYDWGIYRPVEHEDICREIEQFPRQCGYYILGFGLISDLRQESLSQDDIVESACYYFDDAPQAGGQISKSQGSSWSDFEVTREKARAHTVEALVGGASIGHTHESMPISIAGDFFDRFVALCGMNPRFYVGLILGDVKYAFHHGVLVISDRFAAVLYVVEDN